MTYMQFMRNVAYWGGFVLTLIIGGFALLVLIHATQA